MSKYEDNPERMTVESIKNRIEMDRQIVETIRVGTRINTEMAGLQSGQIMSAFMLEAVLEELKASSICEIPEELGIEDPRTPVQKEHDRKLYELMEPLLNKVEGFIEEYYSDVVEIQNNMVECTCEFCKGNSAHLN